MSREILFRGKRTDNGEWVEGNLTRCAVVGETHIQKIEDNLSTTMCKVDPETVCQYTGLIDRDAGKIFEGDIIRYIDETIGKEKVDEVKYNETHAAFCRLHKNEIVGLQYLWFDECIANRCEIIGNIFDNPELLEGE